MEERRRLNIAFFVSLRPEDFKAMRRKPFAKSEELPVSGTGMAVTCLHQSGVEGGLNYELIGEVNASIGSTARCLERAQNGLSGTKPVLILVVRRLLNFLQNNLPKTPQKRPYPQREAADMSPSISQLLYFLFLVRTEFYEGIG